MNQVITVKRRSPGKLKMRVCVRVGFENVIQDEPYKFIDMLKSERVATEEAPADV